MFPVPLKITRLLPRAALALVFVCSTSTAQAPWDVRVALVIGNSRYVNTPSLSNALNDAKAVAAALRSLGFKVEMVEDGSKQRMDAALAGIQQLLRKRQGLAMLYYAGHGVQVNWRNYMLPVEIRLTTPAELPGQSLDVAAVIEVFRAAETRMNIVVLDACRDNPFGTAGSGKGLAPMDAPPGTLLAYATQPGNVADDGDELAGNGPYAQFLTLELRRPFARVEDVFKRVRYQVRKTTRGRQIPWESTSLEEDFVFNDGSTQFVDSGELDKLAREATARQIHLTAQATKAKEREQQLAQALARERDAQEQAARLAESQRVADARRAAELARAAAENSRLERERQQEQAAARKREEEWIARERESRERERQIVLQRAEAQERQRRLDEAVALAKEAELARQQQVAQVAAQRELQLQLQKLTAAQRREQQFAVEKRDWDEVRDSRNATDVYQYLSRYPNGAVSELAQAKLEQLDRPKITPVADQMGLVQPFEAQRFRRGDQYQFVVRDLLTNLEVERPSFTVTSAGAEFAEFDQGYQVTQAGAIMRTIGGATLDPYQQWIPAGEYQVGRKWFTRSIMTPRGGSPQWVELNGRVVAREKVTVPAGTFDTYKLQMEQLAQDGSRLKITYWGQPDWGVAIKQIREIRNSRGQLSGQVYEMLARKRGG